MSEYSWVEQTPIGIADSRVAISPDGLTMVATKRNDYIWTTADGGQNWVERTNSPIVDWSGADVSLDGQKIFACARSNSNDAYLYFSIDGGANWTQNTAAGQASWFDIAMSDDGQDVVAIASGLGAALKVTNNGGTSWAAKIGETHWGVCCSADGVRMYASPSLSGEIDGSSNSGVTWADLNSEPPVPLIARGPMGCSSSGAVVALSDRQGSANPMYLSFDSGATWEASATSGLRNWDYCAVSGDGSTIIAVVAFGEIYASTDAGATWTEQINLGLPTGLQWDSVATNLDGSVVIASAVGDYTYVGTKIESRQPDKTTYRYE